MTSGLAVANQKGARSFTDPEPTVRGVIATRFGGRTKLAPNVVDDVQERYHLDVIDPPVPRSATAEAYRQLAATLEAT